MEYASATLIGIAAIGLFIIAGISALNDRTATTSTVLAFAFLLCVLLLASKFKHIKGFGFEAETWDEKQVEAAKLVDQLSTTSEVLNQQVALIASKLGLWSSGLSNLELDDLLAQAERMLEAGGTSAERRAELLAPVARRIELNYWGAVRQLISKAYQNKDRELQSKLQSASADDRPPIQSRLLELSAERQKIESVTYEKFHDARSLSLLISPATSSKLLEPSDGLLTDLRELNEDYEFFKTNHKLRRRIDLDYVYR